eukprot:TRINITY_DN4546_c0_g2_i1.p1 TRINITY_DN4546_c0_g2~~TRINITY_DN4546_c0_g2_i1.p1  ORF type:complete len:860 (+),score=312.47 TRINITY_DN4546_c0_g2_i1:77-2581(+)
MSERVQVVVRFRPVSDREGAHGPADQVVGCEGDEEVRFSGEGYTAQPKRFTYDRVFDPASEQAALYAHIARPTVENVLKGYNGSVLAYGQTGSGKTHSMMGPDGGNPALLVPGHERYGERGIIPRIAEDLFAELGQLDEKEVEWTVAVQCFELYKEAIHDLCAPAHDQKEYRIREDSLTGRGVYVENLREEHCRDAASLLRIVRDAARQRQTAATGANETSSRSHCVTIITVNQVNNVLDNRTRAHLHLVDLAGSEKVGKTGAQGDRLKEAQMINLSLTLLGNVIFKLTDGRSLHIPYRDSKLTRLLQDSFGGNSRTTLLCNCSTHRYNAPETLSTLQFASRAKLIKNKPVCGKELSGDELRLAYQRALEEIRQLKDQLSMQEPRSTRAPAPRADGPGACCEHEDELEDLRRKNADTLEALREAKENLFEATARMEAHRKELDWYRRRVSELEGSEQQLKDRLKREQACSAQWARRWHDRTNRELMQQQQQQQTKPKPGDALARTGSHKSGGGRKLPQGHAGKAMRRNSGGRSADPLSARESSDVGAAERPNADAASEQLPAPPRRPGSGGSGGFGGGRSDPGTTPGTPTEEGLAALPPDPALLDRIEALEAERDQSQRRCAAAERLYTESQRAKIQYMREVESRNDKIDELERLRQLDATKQANLERELKQARDELGRLSEQVRSAALSHEEKERIFGRCLQDSEAQLSRLREEHSELGRLAGRLRDAAAQREYCELVGVELAVKAEDIAAAENDLQMLEAWTVDRDVKMALATNALGTLGDAASHFEVIRLNLAKEPFTAQETEAQRLTLLRQINGVLERNRVMAARIHSLL